MSSSSAAPAPVHPWKFYRIGGLDQAAIETGADLLALEHLDQKLWVALACPVKGLDLDEKTLVLIDSDGDGRIRAPELITAIKWGAARLKDATDLLAGRDSLPLSALADSTPEGKAVVASARQTLAGLGKPTATELSLTDVADTAKIFATTKLNGDGIITTASDESDDDSVIADIIATQGSVADRSGLPGINQSKVDAFFATCADYASWCAKGTSADVATLGENTATAAAAIAAVRTKVDDYFARCRLAAYDGRALAALNRSEAEYLTIAAQDLKITSEELAGFPLARIAADQPLPLLGSINPAWASAIATLQGDAVGLVHGAQKAELTADEWSALKAKVAAYEAWQATKAGSGVEKLGLERVRTLLASDAQARLTALIAADAALAPEFIAIVELEKLLRLRRDLRTLLANFVNFFDFYSPDRLATFQAGTLYLDSRSSEFVIEVAGPSPLAVMSKLYLAYCDCRRGSVTKKIAAAFTQGDSDYLFVGRNGIFYDRQGRDWDATITSVVDNPISIRQAFWSPYKKFIRFLEEQAAKRAAAAESSSTAKLEATATTTVDAAATGKKPDTKPKMDVGTIAALGVGLGAVGTILGGAIGAFFGLKFYMPLGILGIMLLISGPSMLIAWLKLRQRNLGPVLEANGWAINGRVKINLPFGIRLTDRATLPPGAIRSLDDPYADKAAAARRRTILTVLVLLLLAAAAVWVRLDQRKYGHYFWQEKPVAPAVPEAAPTAPDAPPAAPTTPAPAAP